MNAGSAPVTAFFRPSFFSSVEKYGEKKNTASWRFSDSASANCVSFIVDLVDQVAVLGHLEQRPGVDRRYLFHYR